MTETPHLATDIDQEGRCFCGRRADDPVHLIPEHAEYDTNPEATKLVEDWAARRLKEEEVVEIDDPDLRFLILGMLRMVPVAEWFPLKVREVVDNLDDQGDIKNFTIVTESGLRYTVDVHFDGQS